MDGEMVDIAKESGLKSEEFLLIQDGKYSSKSSL
jgi:hypothetical protein